MATDLGFVAHAAQRHTHEVAAGGARDRLAERGLADARRADQAEDRAFQLARALLHGEVFKDALLDLLQTIMVVVQHLLGVLDVFLDLAALAPRDRQHPVEIIADDGGLGRHRAHRAQLLDLGQGLFAGFLAQAGLLDAQFDLGHFVAAVLALAQFLLDRLELFVQVILALGLLHLALHARADLLLHLQHADLALHHGVNALKAFDHVGDLQQLLLVADLDGEMRGDGIGQFGGIVDLVQRHQHFGRNLPVQLHILLELVDHRTRQRLGLAAFTGIVGDHLGLDLEEIRVLVELDDLGALAAFDQHLHGAVGQAQQLQHRSDGADAVNVFGIGIILTGILLGDQQDLLVVLHDILERPHRLFAADEERHDHMREYDDVPQRQDRKYLGARRCKHAAFILRGDAGQPGFGHPFAA